MAFRRSTVRSRSAPPSTSPFFARRSARGARSLVSCSRLEMSQRRSRHRALAERDKRRVRRRSPTACAASGGLRRGSRSGGAVEPLGSDGRNAPLHSQRDKVSRSSPSETTRVAGAGAQAGGQVSGRGHIRPSRSPVRQRRRPPPGAKATCSRPHSAESIAGAPKGRRFRANEGDGLVEIRAGHVVAARRLGAKQLAFSLDQRGSAVGTDPLGTLILRRA